MAKFQATHRFTPRWFFRKFLDYRTLEVKMFQHRGQWRWATNDMWSFVAYSWAEKLIYRMEALEQVDGSNS